MIRLCKHSAYEVDDEDVLTILAGSVAVPLFIWSAERWGDVPVLRCSHCYKTISLVGIVAVIREDQQSQRPGFIIEHQQLKNEDDEGDELWDEEEDDDVEWSDSGEDDDA